MNKLRPNVLLLALMATVSAITALWLTFHYLAGADVLSKLAGNPELGVLLGLIIGATVGALVGSLLTLAGQVATDHPPSYPAEPLPDLIRSLRKKNDKED